MAASTIHPTCTCEADRLRTTDHLFEVAPRTGGGWEPWVAALGRLLTRLVAGPAHCVVITQRPNQRYLQLMIGHGHVHLEASSNYYLDGDFRLSENEEEALRSFGFRTADDEENEDRWPRNFWQEADLDPDGAIVLAERITAVLMTVMLFDEVYPVTVNIFGADRPCPVCAWGSDD